MDSCMCCNLQPFLKILRVLITIIQWSVPLILLVLGTFDMVKAVTKATDEKMVQEARRTLIKRLIYGAVIFLVPFIVRVVLRFVDDNLIKGDDTLSGPTSWIDCWLETDSNKACVGCEDIYLPPEGNLNNNGNNSDSGTNSNDGSTETITCYSWKEYNKDCSNAPNELYSTYKSHFSELSFNSDGTCETTSKVSPGFPAMTLQGFCLDIGGFIKKFNIDSDDNFVCAFKVDAVTKYSTTKPNSTSDGYYDAYECSQATFCNESTISVCGNPTKGKIN